MKLICAHIHLKSNITFPTKRLFSFVISSMGITRLPNFILVTLLTITNFVEK